MSGGTGRYGKKKKSVQNVNYIAQKRHELHKKQRIEATSAFKAKKHTEVKKTPRGTARKAKRSERSNHELRTSSN